MTNRMGNLLTYSYPEVKTQNKGSPLESKEQTPSSSTEGRGRKEERTLLSAVLQMPDFYQALRKKGQVLIVAALSPHLHSHSHRPASYSRWKEPITSWITRVLKSSWDSTPLRVKPFEKEKWQLTSRTFTQALFLQILGKTQCNSYEMMWPSHKLPQGGRKMLNNPNSLWGNHFTLFFIVTSYFIGHHSVCRSVANSNHHQNYLPF